MYVQLSERKACLNVIYVCDLCLFVGMVATGATVLMAASEESPSNGTEYNSTRLGNQNVSSQCNEIRHNERSAECPVKKIITPAVNSKHILFVIFVCFLLAFTLRFYENLIYGATVRLGENNC